MSSNLELPIVELEGVGPHIAAVLAPLGVSTIGDLLRVPSLVLHASVAAMASEKQVGAWRQMACFLEIPAMTPQWAEALIWREIYTHVDLCQAGYAQLLAHFEAAKAARRIDTVPEPAALAAIMTGAATLAYTGAVTGALVTEADEPVSGAEVRIGRVRTTSDARGRFRIAGLPRRQKLLLVASHDSVGSARVVVEAVRTDAPVVQRLTLSPGGSPYRRSQLEGQRLPRDLDYPIVATEVTFDTLADDDLLKVILFYADGQHVKLTSKLLDFEDGEIRIHWAKAPLEALPAGLRLHDHLIKRAAGWRKVTMNPGALRAYKRMLRVKAQFRGRPAPTSLDERKALYDELLTALVDANAL